MTMFLNELGLRHILPDQETFERFLYEAMHSGYLVKTHFADVFYINCHFGWLQVVTPMVISEEGEGRAEMPQAHLSGICEWDVRIDHELEPVAGSVFNRKAMVSREDYAWPVVMRFVNGDVLASMAPDEHLHVQVVGFPLDVNYAENMDDLGEQLKGKTDIRPKEGGLVSLRLLHEAKNQKNRRAGEECKEENMDEDNRDATLLLGRIKQVQKAEIEIFDQEVPDVLDLVVETELGDLEIVHSLEMVSPEQREKIKEGNLIFGLFILSADAAEGITINGPVVCRTENMKRLRGVLCGENPDRLAGCLEENCLLISSESEGIISGREAVIQQIRLLQKDTTNAEYVVVAEREELSTLPFTEGSRGIALSCGEDDDFFAVLFPITNESGKIDTIYINRESDYAYRRKDPFDSGFWEENDDWTCVRAELIRQMSKCGIGTKIEMRVLETICYEEDSKLQKAKEAIRILKETQEAPLFVILDRLHNKELIWNNDELESIKQSK